MNNEEREIPYPSSFIPHLLLAAFETGVAGGGELVLELLDAAGRIDELQLARVEGVAHAADIDLQLFARAARGELVAAAAGDLRFVIFGMDAVFHGRVASICEALKCTATGFSWQGLMNLGRGTV